MNGRPGSLVELLQRRAGLSAEDHALTFLEDGETRQITMSFRDLDERARPLILPTNCALARSPHSLFRFSAFSHRDLNH